MANTSFIIIKCLKDAPEYFVGLDVVSGTPRWSDKVQDAQLWESRLHAESQALLMVRHKEALRAADQIGIYMGRQGGRSNG